MTFETETGAQLDIWLEGGYGETFSAKRENFFGPP